MKKYCTLLILALIATISCNRVENIFRGDSDKVKIVINGCEEYDNTRSIVKINPDAKANVTFSFENNDLLGVFPDVDYSQQLKLKAVGADKDGKSFSGNTVGWLLNGEKSYAAYYPFNADYHQRPDNIVFSYKGQKQVGNGNTESNLAHLGGYTFLYSKPVRPSDNSATFGMNNASAFLHIRHFSENGGTFTKMTISANDGSKSIPTALKANLFPKGTGAVSDTVAIDSLSTSIAVNLDNYTVEAKQNLNVWCALPPVDLSGETLVFKFFDADGNVADSFEKPGQDMTLKDTGRWKIHNFIEQVYALKYHANAEGATFADGATEYKDIKVATGASCDFTVIGENGDEKLSFPGHELIGWAKTEKGEAEYAPEEICTLENEDFETIDMSMDLFAVWGTLADVTVSVEADPVAGGTVTIDGEAVPSKDVAPSTKVTIAATATDGYEFTKWSDGVTDASREVTVNGDVTYTAEFTKSQTQADGSLPGLFSVSATKKVKFSQGNLQYHRKEHIWRFAPNQYDYIGDGGTNYGNVSYGDNTKIADDDYDGWIDLFGWGTSGFNLEGYQRTYYKPTSYNNGTYDYKNYYCVDANSNPIDLSTAENIKTDWGCNNIGFWENGAFYDKSNAHWRTMNTSEWAYLINSRTNSYHQTKNLQIKDGNNILYNAPCVLIFPDNWDSSYTSPNTNISDEFRKYFTEISCYQASSNKRYYVYNQNGYPSTSLVTTKELFEQLQDDGIVFLPITGSRKGQECVAGANKFGIYWISTHQTAKYSYIVHFGLNGTSNQKLLPNGTSTTYTVYSLGNAVRLVTDVK